ncbi:MAG: fumarylacetoacetate hydrolase family protein [Candidatus Omnitrophica bacterium]|nr:fumarylacetoacetate hydrolase family protein [Candidatus Omnitrophota bacterium]
MKLVRFIPPGSNKPIYGKLKQFSNTKNLIFPVEKLVSFVSGIMTLLPGDVIATGTPPGVGQMALGDTVKIEIEGIGSLVNKVTK